MNSDFFNHIKQAISEDRINSYGQDGATELVILSRYLWNIAICQALYSPLQMAEIALRNAANQAFTGQYGIDWYDKAPLLALHQTQIGNAKSKIAKQGKAITLSRVVEELHFGFWVSFFNKSNSNNPLTLALLKNDFKHCLRNERNIRFQNNRWNLVRNLRNCVFHHERIIHWKDLARQHNLLIETIGWISPELQEMAQRLDCFSETYSAGIDPWKEKIRNHWPNTKDNN